jgi:hypothetical protein
MLICSPQTTATSPVTTSWDGVSMFVTLTSMSVTDSPVVPIFNAPGAGDTSTEMVWSSTGWLASLIRSNSPAADHPPGSEMAAATSRSTPPPDSDV